ncbi:MAG: DNA polymerase III subunit [Planctomycetota bacterium]|jgi:DNA polymerase-3 subunit delta'
MIFRDIFCQDRATNTLQRAFASGRWAHAYIFAGPEGVGKFKTAREWARLLGCKEPVADSGVADGCGVCDSCRLFEAESSPDFNHVYKELLEFTENGKGKTTPVDLPIDVIREFLIAKAPAKPTVSQRKVFVVSEAERLNINSQNCLLKVLEEPPEYCCIVLLCTRLEKLLPTTKSRCQTIRFGPINEDKIVEKLKEMGLGNEPARYFARLAEGSLGMACRWAELELAEANLYGTKQELLRSLAGYELADALNLAEKFVVEGKRIAGVWTSLDKNTSKTDVGRRATKTLIRMIVLALHDAMTLSLGTGGNNAEYDQEEQVEKLAARFGGEGAAERIAHCYRMLQWIESNVNEKLIFEQLLLTIADSDTIPAWG